MAKNTSQLPDAGTLTGAELIPVWQDGVQKKVLRSVFIAGLGGGGGSYTLPAATAGALGGIRVGTGLAIDGSGILSAPYAYTLPMAAAGVLGGVKVGSGLAIDGAGVLSAPGGGAGPPGASAYEIAVDNGYIGTELQWLDSLRSGDALPGAWDPSMLTIPPASWFDADTNEGLLDLVAQSTTITALRSKFNPSAYSMIPTGSVCAQHRNPNFGMRRTIYFSGSSNAQMQLVGSGAAGLLRNKPGATIIWFGRFLTEFPSAGEGYLISTSAPASSTARATLGKSQSVGNGFRYGGRRLDGNSFDGQDIGGNRGTTPNLVIASFDWTNARKFLRINGEQVDNDTAFQTSGNSSDSDSGYIGIAAFQAVGGFATQFELALAAVHDNVWSDADLQKIEGYVLHRARLSTLMPDVHPYKLAPPVS